MAHLNFTPPPTPSDSYSTGDFGDIPHPMVSAAMSNLITLAPAYNSHRLILSHIVLFPYRCPKRHVWRHRYSHSQSSQSSFAHEPHKITSSTYDIYDRKEKKLQHRRSTGTVIQNFDSTTTTYRTFWNAVDMTGPGYSPADSAKLPVRASKSPRYVYSVDDMRGKCSVSETADVLHANDTTVAQSLRSKMRPSPLNLTESSQQKIKEKISKRDKSHHSIAESQADGLDVDDEFSTLRDQITEITRELQQMQIQELQIQEKTLDEDRKQRQKLLEISQRDRIQQGRRLSISNAYQIEPIDGTYEPTHRHHRVRSHGSFFSHHQSFSLESSSATAFGLTTHHDHEPDMTRNHRLIPPPSSGSNFTYAHANGPTHGSATSSDDEVDMDDNSYQSLPASPNMTTLLLTTNSLISSRMEEMARSVSPHDQEDKIWHNDFVNVMSKCIHQSEELESLSTDLLKLERQMRELFILKSSIEEQLEHREYMYNSQIEQCDRELSFQRQMITDLESMMMDIDRKMELAAMRSSQTKTHEPLDEEISIGKMLALTKKEELVAQLRWKVGRFIGGGVGTGSIIHAYDSPNAGHSMIIGGTASTMEESLADVSLALTLLRLVTCG